MTAHWYLGHWPTAYLHPRDRAYLETRCTELGIALIVRQRGLWWGVVRSDYRGPVHWYHGFPGLLAGLR